MKMPQFNVTRRNFNFVLCTLLIPFALLTSCVTVNVNFPESAVQKATDDYVRDLYRTKEQGKPGAAPKVTTSPAARTSFNLEFLNFMPSAEAADQSFNLSSPKLDEIKTKLKASVGDVIEQKKAGVLGESNEGRLVVKDSSRLKPLLKKRVDDLVEVENQNRDTLYDEVIHANPLAKGNLVAVKKSFARSFQAESPSGTWVQGETGAWAQKP
ncbi:MAG: DUF1318 domain-containing protein [Bdellovibrionales bacterium]|nr:DUF1318 domain-containing protein [Oligoflexia bacterium]